MPTKEELIHRWDNFLTKIENRFNESLEQAEAACFEQLHETDFDYYTVFRSWQGIKAQIQLLIQKIHETWHQKVEPEMRYLGDFWTDESYKSSELSDRLTSDLEAFQRTLEGKLSLLFYNHVMAKTDEHIPCSQCNAMVAINMAMFRAQYLICAYCNTVNTYEPTTQFHQIGWNIIDNIAAHNTKAYFEAMETASEALRLQRKPVAQHYWNQYKKAYFQYYEAYFKERIKYNAEAADRYEDDMKRKTKEYNDYEQIQRN